MHVLEKLVIIGSGPAAFTAGLYAGRAELRDWVAAQHAAAADRNR